MNVDIEKTVAFSAVLDETNNSPWINTYEVKLCMTIHTEQISEYNVAYERVKHWINVVMQDSVLGTGTSRRATTWKDSGMKFLDFPVFPADQVIGLMLMRKLTAITEGRIMIRRVSVTSPADDFVTYHCDHSDDLHWFDTPGWWSDSKPTHNTSGARGKNSGKVISILRSQDWKDHDLDWHNGSACGGNVSLLPGPDRDV